MRNAHRTIPNRSNYVRHTLPSGRVGMFRIASEAHALTALDWVKTYAPEGAAEGITPANVAGMLDVAAAVVGMFWYHENLALETPNTAWRESDPRDYGTDVLDEFTGAGFTSAEVIELFSFLVPILVARITTDTAVLATVDFSPPE